MQAGSHFRLALAITAGLSPQPDHQQKPPNNGPSQRSRAGGFGATETLQTNRSPKGNVRAPRPSRQGRGGGFTSLQAASCRRFRRTSGGMLEPCMLSSAVNWWYAVEPGIVLKTGGRWSQGGTPTPAWEGGLKDPLFWGQFGGQNHEIFFKKTKTPGTHKALGVPPPRGGEGVRRTTHPKTPQVPNIYKKNPRAEHTMSSARYGRVCPFSISPSGC